MTTATRRLSPHDWPEPKKPMVFRDFKTTTSFGYNPRATPPAPPAAPAVKPKPKPKKTQAPQPSVPVVIAPQNN